MRRLVRKPKFKLLEAGVVHREGLGHLQTATEASYFSIESITISQEPMPSHRTTLTVEIVS